MKISAVVSCVAIAAGLSLVGPIACKSDKSAPPAEISRPQTPPGEPTAPKPVPVAAAPVPAAPVPAAPVHSDLLTDAQMERTKAVQQILAEVDPTPLEEWIEDVTRDNNPERELKMYEGMAKAYRTYCEGKTLSHDAKMDVYQVALLRSEARDSAVLPQLKLKELSLAEAKKILRRYPEPPMSHASH